MSWRHFYYSSSKVHFYIAISYDRHFSSCQRNDNLFADEMLISAIIWMNCNSSISKQSFRSCCSKNKALISSDNRIFDFSEISLLIKHFYFIISKSGSTARTSIDHIFSLIDESIIVEVYKVLFHSFRKPLIQSKSLSLPVE